MPRQRLVPGASPAYLNETGRRQALTSAGYANEAETPFAQLDWSLPAGLRRTVQQPFQPPRSLLYSDVPIPFNQYHWPNPRRPMAITYAYGPAGISAGSSSTFTAPGPGWITIIRRRRYT